MSERVLSLKVKCSLGKSVHSALYDTDSHPANLTENPLKDGGNFTRVR